MSNLAFKMYSIYSTHVGIFEASQQESIISVVLVISYLWVPIGTAAVQTALRSRKSIDDVYIPSHSHDNLQSSRKNMNTQRYET